MLGTDEVNLISELMMFKEMTALPEGGLQQHQRFVKCLVSLMVSFILMEQVMDQA